MKKRVLSLFLAITLCLTLTPTGALAAEGQPPEQTVSVTQEAETDAGENASPAKPEENPTEDAPAAAEKNTVDKEAGQNEPTVEGENEPLALGLDDAGQNAADGENGEAGGTSISEGDTQTEIWCTRKPSSIQRGYNGTTDGSTIPIDLTFTDGTNEIKLTEGTGFTATKTFDSADAGNRTVTVEITLTGEAAKKYKLRAGEEKFEIGGYINKAYPDLTVTLSKTACTAGEKLLPLLSVEGAPKDAEVTYYYLASAYKSWAGSSDVEGSDAMPKIDENTAISEPGTYYVYAKTGETKNYEVNRSATVELAVSEKVDPVVSVKTADGTETPYGSFVDAWTAAVASEGSTLKLLADGTLSGDNTDISKSITLDLNGYVLGSNGSLTVKNGAALTVKNAGAEKSEKPVKAGLYLNLLVEKGGSFTCTDGVLQYLGLLSAGTGDYAIKLAEGENHCTFGGFAQGDESATVGDLLKAAPGMALHGDNSGSDVQITRSTLISKGFNYFSFYVGPCSEHQIGEDGTCDYCGASYVASVTTGGETVSYTSLDDALNAAQDGDTVTLLSDVDLGETYVTISKSITFDLNGKTLSSSGEWLLYGVLLVKDATVTVKNGTVKAAGDGSCAIQAYRSGAIMTLEDVTATVTSGKSSVTVGDFGSAVIKSGDYQGLYVGKNSHVTLEGGTFRPYMDNITNKNVKSIFWKVNETTDATSRDCMELLGNGCVYVDENGNQVRTGGGFNTVVTVQQGTAIDAPVAKIGDVEYASLSKAINAVQNGGTITLLDDLDLGNGAVLQVGSSKKNFTIDLDNHTLSADGACLIMLHNGSQLTLKNGTLDGSRCTSYHGVLYISSNSGPKLTLENVTAKSGSVADSLNDQRSVLLAYVAYGTVVFDGGTYTGGVLLITDGNAVLKSGTFQKGTNDYSIKTEDSGKHLSDYLDDDSQFWNDNTPLDLSNETQTADEVTVRPCKHNWKNGKCTVCQKVCDHGSADGKSMTAAVCPTCGMKAAAQVDITGSDAKYFLTFSDALVYATQNNGCTLKLLANVTDPVSINTPFIFDLNGHNFNKLSVGARAKIRDSSTTKGTIRELKVFNMTDETVLTVADLLEEGYAFKSSSGNKWYFGVENAITNVTVQPAPIKSVTAEHPTVTVEYGKTSGVTLTATAVLATEGGTVSYQWYKIGGTDFPIQDATENTYQLPADLGAGMHTYRLTATSDGYPKSVDITVKVTPISLKDAEVTVQNPTYNGEGQRPEVTVKLGETTLTRGTDFYVTAQMQTDAGSYTLTVNGENNYTGKIENVEWKIEPMKIDSVMVSSDISKVYDGTAEINMSANEWATALKFKTLSAYAAVDVPSGAYTISDAYFVEKSGEETFHSPDAGEKYGISFKITLKSNNYVLQTYDEDTPSTSKEITQSGGANFTIRQANVTSPGEITQLVFNDLAKTYTLNLAALLPELSEGCEYGDIQYQGCDYHFTDSTYLDSNNGMSVSKEGILTLPTVSAHTSDVNTQIGTITVPVVTTNYQNFEFTIKVVISARIPLNASGVTVSASDITYGQTLNESKLTATGTMKHPGTGEEVKGTFAWTNPEAKPGAAGDYTASWTFTPAEGYEEYATATGNVTVKVNKADPTFTAPAAKTLTYTGSEQTLLTAGSTQDGTMMYRLGESGEFVDSIPNGKDAGTYTVCYKVVGDGNHNDTEVQFVSVTIKPMELLRFVSTPSVTKTYDGTAVAPLSEDAVTFNSRNASKLSLPKGAYSITNARFTMKQTDGNYADSPEVGNGKSLSFTVTLTSDNYVFESMTEDSKTIVCDIATDAEDKFTITKATAPTGIQTGTLNVINGTTLEYTYDAKQILPAAPNGTYGTVLYSGEPSSDFESGYTVNSFRVGINSGVLTLTIDAQNGGKTGKIGSVTIYVTTDNYESFNLPLDLYAVNKITPVADGKITAADITYGDALSKSTISGKMKDPNTGATVNGTFTWTDGTVKPDANDSYEAEWTFTPAAGYEKYATATGTVTIKVNKADIPTKAITAPAARENLTYTGQEQALITAGMTDYGTMQYSLTEDGTYSQDIPTGTDAGAYTVWYRVIGDENHNDTKPASVPVSIGKKPLTITGVMAKSKPYDGTTNADISSVTFDNVILKRDTDYTVTASFDDASVDNGKNVTATVTLMGQAAKNYFLEQSSFTTTASITKAAAPGSDFHPAVTVINGLAKTYEMVLSNDYLPKLSSPCEYGNVSYSLRGTYLTDGYKDTVQVKVMEENGQYKLKLTVPAVDYNKVSSVGTIDVRVTSDNYQDFYLTIGVKTKNKDVPVPDGTISASDITYGQALNDSKIAGKMKAGGKAIDGTFTWTNGTFKPAAGDYTASWTFTPAKGYEEYATATGTATVTVDPKAVTVSITPNGGTYGSVTAAAAVLSGVVDGETVPVTLTYTGTANDGTAYANTTPPAKAGTYTVTATTTNPNYTLDPKTTTADFTIAKRPATVTPDNKSKVYEEKDPDLTYAVSGVLAGETLKGITLTRAEGENAGEYAITATADAGANPNYDVKFAEGTLTIEPKSIKGAKVVLGKGLTANGAEQTQTVEKVLLDDKEIPANSYTVAGNTATAPGSHTLTITAKGNYTGTVEQTYVIIPAKAEDAPGEEIAIGSGEVKVVVKSEGTVPPATLLTNKAELLAMLVDSGDITADELAQIADGASVDIALTVKEANVSAEIKTAMEQAAKGCTIGQYLDISLFKYMTVNGKQQDGVALHTTKNALTISVAVPDALINTNSAVNRTYCIVRNHEGTITVLDAAFDAASKTLTFKTDRFSDYAIAYKDTAVPSSGSNPGSNNSSNGSETKKNEVAAPTPASTSNPSTITAMPQTGDTSNPTLYVVLLVASLLGLAVVFVCKKRNNK